MFACLVCSKYGVVLCCITHRRHWKFISSHYLSCIQIERCMGMLMFSVIILDGKRNWCFFDMLDMLKLFFTSYSFPSLHCKWVDMLVYIYMHSYIFVLHFTCLWFDKHCSSSVIWYNLWLLPPFSLSCDVPCLFWTNVAYYVFLRFIMW